MDKNRRQAAESLLMRVVMIIACMLLYSNCFSQSVYLLRVETGVLSFQGHIVDVDPGPNWKGHNLNENQNGVTLEIINGISIKNKLALGVGLGYLNFEGTNGYSVFGDLRYVPLKSKISPLLNIRAGTSRIWNQYEGGTRTGLFEVGFGVSYRLKDRSALYFSSGVQFTQQALLIPIRLGLRLR